MIDMNDDDKIVVRRWYHPECITGRLYYKGWQCWTLELPWKDNQNRVSAIVPGEYEAFKRNSPSNGRVIELRDVPGRSHIQFHSGNFIRNVLGCILVGDSIRWDPDTISNGKWEPMVTNSVVTMNRLLELAPQEVILQITDR
jgi:hypothetical protein